MISFLQDIQFAEKHWFWLFLLLPVMLAWYLWRLKKYEGELNYSSFQNFSGIKSSLKARFRHVTLVLRLLGVSLLILALARPQSRSSWKDVKTEGIDIVISMFIGSRTNYRICRSSFVSLCYPFLTIWMC